MKRVIRVLTELTVLCCLLLLSSSAAADAGITNPDLKRVRDLEKFFDTREYTLNPEKPGLLRGDDDPIGLRQITAPSLGGVGTWAVLMDTELLGYPLSSSIILTMKDYSDRYTTVYIQDFNGCPSSVSSCPIVSGGEYEFRIFVKTTISGDGGYYGTVRFKIKDDAAHVSLTEKIDAVVSSCKAKTQWQTALNLHDWLIRNVYYDLDLHYYGADMILRGFGVCDGYTKAYLMMCRRAGIPVYRVDNVAHSWNVLKLDNAWYFVDTTWDDPSGKLVRVSGEERYTYFCLNTDLLELDHPRPWNFTDTGEIYCSALDDNYFIRKKDWVTLGNLKNNNTSYSEAIAAQIAANCGGNYIPCDDFFYVDENSGWYVTDPLDPGMVRDWTLLAYAMSREPMLIPGWGYVNLSVYFNAQEKYFLYSISSFSVDETGTLELPHNLKAVAAESFMGINSSSVVIPEGCTSIGAGAFRSSNVHLVRIPASVTRIADTAFSGCGPLLFLLPGNKNCDAIISFATQHGFLWHYQ